MDDLVKTLVNIFRVLAPLLIIAAYIYSDRRNGENEDE